MPLKLSSGQKLLALIAISLTLLIGLYMVSISNYLFFHTIVEITSVIIAVSVFIIAWHSRRYMNNNYLLLLGISYLFVGILQLIHAISYQGMYILHISGTNVASQLWVATRFLQSISLLIAPLFIKKKLDSDIAMVTYAIISALILVSIFYWQVFPVCYVEGYGQTLFKVASEHMIIILLLVAAFLLYRMRKSFDSRVLKLIFASIFATILGELLFSAYVSPFDIFNFIGHIFFVVSFYFIYKAVIVTGIEKPFDIIFRDLDESRRELHDSKEQAELYVDLMAHDINNMNQVGIGYLDLLSSSGTLDEEERAFVHKAQVSLHNSSKLIDNVRKIQQASIVAGCKENIDIARVLDDVKKEYSFIPGKRITINYTRPDKCIVCANGLIKDVFSNIVENAIKHNEGDVEIDIRIDKVTEKGIRQFRVTIEDNGPGIPDELKNLLFLRHQRGPGKVSGSGLGLYLVKTLIDDYHGKVWVEDRVQGDHTKGARFVVILPAVK